VNKVTKQNLCWKARFNGIDLPFAENLHLSVNHEMQTKMIFFAGLLPSAENLWIFSVEENNMKAFVRVEFSRPMFHWCAVFFGLACFSVF